jgi:hypothetical protein
MRTLTADVIRRKRGFSMSRAFAAGASLLALSALVPVPAARGESQSRTRVTIRGTGSDVVIERSAAPVTKRFPEAAAISAGPLGEAIRLKAQGANDTAVIAYLHAHEATLPPVVDSEDVKKLRKAGAGKSVVAYLATAAAVDIGETGEGHEAAVSAERSSPNGLETAPYGMFDAYGLSGGYGTPYRARQITRGFPRARGMAFPPGLPAFQRRISSRAAFPRHPTPE